MTAIWARGSAARPALLLRHARKPLGEEVVAAREEEEEGEEHLGRRGGGAATGRPAEAHGPPATV